MARRIWIFLFVLFLACEGSKKEALTTKEGNNTPEGVKASKKPVSQAQTLTNINNASTASVSVRSNILFKEAEFLSALISPDGKYILTTQEGNIGLKIYTIQDESLKAVISEDRRIGFGAQWSFDSKKVYYKEKQGPVQKVFIYNLETGLTEELQSVPANALQSYALVKKPSDPLVFLNTKTLQVEMQRADGTGKKSLTEDGGQYYNPLLSPDQSMFIIQEGSNMFLMRLQTKEKQDIGTGIASCWSPDSKKLYFFLDESADGHEITGSEIYEYNMVTKNTKKITNTPEVSEMWPSITANGQTLYCTDEKTGTVLKITGF